MSRPDIRLFLTDLDGTFVQKDHYTVGQRTREAMQELKRRGIALCACTGRPAQVLPPAIEEIGFDYTIACNGACCRNCHTGEIVFTAYLTTEQAIRGWELVSPLDVQVGWFTTDGIVADRKNFDRWEARIPLRWHREYFSAGKVRVYEDIREFFAEGTPRLEKLNLYDVTPDIHEKVIDPLLAIGGYNPTSSLGRNLEITASQADKGHAMLSLCDHLGVQPAQAIAFGDGGNDVHMLRLAGVGVAMGNASEKVRTFAPHVTLSNDEDGIADFLEKHIL